MPIKQFKVGHLHLSGNILGVDKGSRKIEPLFDGFYRCVGLHDPAPDPVYTRRIKGIRHIFFNGQLFEILMEGALLGRHQPCPQGYAFRTQGKAPLPAPGRRQCRPPQ